MERFENKYFRYLIINHFDPPSAAKEFTEVLINWCKENISYIQIIRRKYV